MGKCTSQSSFIQNIQKLTPTMTSSISSSNEESFKQDTKIIKFGQKLDPIMKLSSSEDTATSSDRAPSPPTNPKYKTNISLNKEFAGRNGKTLQPTNDSSPRRLSVFAGSNQSTLAGIKDFENRLSKIILQDVRGIVKEEIVSAELALFANRIFNAADPKSCIVKLLSDTLDKAVS